MEWLGTLLSGFALAALLLPAALLLLTVFVLVPMAHLMPAAPTVSRTSFRCPVSRRRVNAAFLVAAGAPRPADVLECSVFPDGDVRCAKGCLEHAEAHPAPSTAVARYALLADGEAGRDPAAGERP